MEYQTFKNLSAEAVNYTQRDIKRAKKRAIESKKKLVHDSIKARLYCESYGELKAEDTLKNHNNSIKVAHTLWKIKNGMEA